MGGPLCSFPLPVGEGKERLLYFDSSNRSHSFANPACIVFNSRGIPVDTAGAPMGGNALYVTDTTGVYATTITATPLVRQWWSSAAAVGWVQR